MGERKDSCLRLFQGQKARHCYGVGSPGSATASSVAGATRGRRRNGRRRRRAEAPRGRVLPPVEVAVVPVGVVCVVVSVEVVPYEPLY